MVARRYIVEIRAVDPTPDSNVTLQLITGVVTIGLIVALVVPRGGPARRPA